MPSTEPDSIGLTKRASMPPPVIALLMRWKKPPGRSSNGFSLMMKVAWSEPWPAMKLYPMMASRRWMAGVPASILSTWSTIFSVRSWLVPGAAEMVTKRVPVSSSGTSPVLVVAIRMTSTAIPATIVPAVIMPWRIIHSTPPLYLLVIFSNW